MTRATAPAFPSVPHAPHVAHTLKRLLPGIFQDQVQITYVSVLSDAGIAIEEIADTAGHINSGITARVYRHQIADVVARAAEAMDRIFGAGSAS